MVEKLLAKFDFSEEEIKISEIKVIAADAEIGQMYLVKRKIRGITTNSTILMNGQISRPWFQNCPSILSLQSGRTNARYYHRARGVSGRIRITFYSAANWKPFILNWNSAQLFLGLPLLDRRKSVSCLVDMDGPSQGTWNYVRKGTTLALAEGPYSQALGLRYAGRKSSHQKQKQILEQLK